MTGVYDGVKIGGAGAEIGGVGAVEEGVVVSGGAEVVGSYFLVSSSH